MLTQIVRKFFILIVLLVFSCRSFSLCPPADAGSSGFIKDKWRVIGRGLIDFRAQTVVIKDCFISLKNQTWGDHKLQFKARAVPGSEQVQIWAGFHFKDRDYRYALGLRGGNCDDLYLCRYTPEGQNKMLALESLGFHLEPGQWFTLGIVVWQGNIRVFLNGEKEPRIQKPSFKIITLIFQLQSCNLTFGNQKSLVEILEMNLSRKNTNCNENK